MVFSWLGIKGIAWLFLRWILLVPLHSSLPIVLFIILMVQLFRGFMTFLSAPRFLKCVMLLGKIIGPLISQLLLVTLISWELFSMIFLLFLWVLFCVRIWLVQPCLECLCSHPSDACVVFIVCLGFSPNNLPQKKKKYI